MMETRPTLAEHTRSAALSSRTRCRLRLITLPLLSFTCLLGVGCDSSSDAEPADTESPLYAVGVTIFTPDSELGLAYLTNDISAVARAEPSDGLPLGHGGVKALPGERAFVHVSFDQPTATRYDITEDGTVVEGATVSTLATGGSFLYAEAVSDSGKLWMTVFPQFRVLEIDPASMTIERELDLFSELDKGYPNPLMGTGSSVVRDNVLFMPVYHRNWNDVTALPITEIVALDMATGDYEILVDESCPFGSPALAGDEIIVSGTDVFGASYGLYGREDFGRPCMRRIPAGQTSFDPSFIYDLTLADGAPAAEVVPVSTSIALVRVFDWDLAPAPDEVEDHFSYSYSDAWRWGRLLLDTPGAIEVLPGGSPSFGRVDRFRVDGEPWSFNYTDASEGDSTLLRLTEDGPVEGLTVTGYVNSIERIL